jgi:DUF917 family protein
MVPDLIMNLEVDTDEPITTEMMRYGQQLAVIGKSAHDPLKTPKALTIVLALASLAWSKSEAGSATGL